MASPVNNAQNEIRLPEEHLALKLLQFFARYPNARFSTLTLTRAINETKIPVEQSLSELVRKGIIISHNVNNTAFFSLTTDITLHNQVIELAKPKKQKKQSKECQLTFCEIQDSLTLPR